MVRCGSSFLLYRWMSQPPFLCILLSVSMIIQFLLKRFSEFVNNLSLSDRLVFIVLSSVFFIFQFSCRSQSLPIGDFMSSLSFIRIVKFFCNSSTLSFYRNLLNEFDFNVVEVLIFACIRQYFLVFHGFFIRWSVASGEPVSTMNCFVIL